MVLKVLYDGTCPFCVYSARNLKKIDWFHNLSLVNLYTPGILENYDISLESATNRIQVIRNEKEHKEGMEAILLISRSLPLLWLFIPFFWISIKLGFGVGLYDWIAKNRFLFPIPGYCPFPEPEDILKNNKNLES